MSYISHILANQICTLDDKLVKLTNFARQESLIHGLNTAGFLRAAVHQYNILGLLEIQREALMGIMNHYATTQDATDKIIQLYGVSLSPADIAVLAKNTVIKLVNMDLNIITNEELLFRQNALLGSKNKPEISSIVNFIAMLVELRSSNRTIIGADG